MGDRLSYVGVAITTTNNVVLAEPMLTGTSAPKTKLIALTKTLELG